MYMRNKPFLSGAMPQNSMVEAEVKKIIKLGKGLIKMRLQQPLSDVIVWYLSEQISSVFSKNLLCSVEWVLYEEPPEPRAQATFFMNKFILFFIK